MKLIKLLAFVILTISILNCPNPQTISTTALELNQDTLSVSYNTTEITMYRNETRTLEAEVRRNGGLITGAYFLIPELNYDLGETVTDLDNGTYLIHFIPASNDPIESNNYSVDLIAVHEDLNTSTPFMINLLSYDVIAPNLIVFEPLSEITYTTYMYVNLTGSDDVEWKELRIEFRDQIVFRLFRSEADFGRGVWNDTHISFSDYIFFDNLQGSNEILITLTDTSQNSIQVVRNSVGDALPPSITWKQPLDGSVITERTVELSWNVEDDVAVESIVLDVNSFELGSYSADIDKVTVNVPIPEDKVQLLIFTLTATDTSGNIQTESLQITYDPNFIIDNQQMDPTQSLVEIFTYILLAILIIGALIVLRSLVISLRERSKNMKQKSTHLEGFPTTDILRILDNFDISSEARLQIQNNVETMKKKIIVAKKEDLVKHLNELNESLDQIAGDDETLSEILRLIDLTLQNWVSMI